MACSERPVRQGYQDGYGHVWGEVRAEAGPQERDDAYDDQDSDDQDSEC